MIFFEIIFYQTYLFYLVIFGSEEPAEIASGVMSAALALIIMFSFLLVHSFYFCTQFDIVILFIMHMGIMLPFNYYFSRDNRKLRVITKKMLLKNSAGMSKVLAIIFYLIAFSMPLFGISYGKMLYESHSR
ncbi:MAG: hypothetical protein ACOYMA_18090 [Bacteroidia bacterium]